MNHQMRKEKTQIVLDHSSNNTKVVRRFYWQLARVHPLAVAEERKHSEIVWLGTMAKDDSAMSGTSHSTSKKKEAPKPMATWGETFQFVVDCGPRIQLIFAIGAFAGCLNGLVYPILAYLFSSSFSDISAASNDGLAQVLELAYTFMIVGTYALVCATIQGWCFETVAAVASQNFRLQWFRALLRQDPAFFGTLVV
jgi:hypothetical protein